MPNKGGYELLVWMRAHEKFGKLPFIMATGEGDLKQEKKAVDAGVSSFIAKPFNSDELKKKIDQAFGIDISRIREIIGRLPIRSMPQTPPFIKGVINLRGKVIPVMDLRLRFGNERGGDYGAKLHHCVGAYCGWRCHKRWGSCRFGYRGRGD